MNSGPFSWRKRARGFVYAWRGIKALVLTEHNARIHCVAALMALVAGWVLRISAGEWVAVVVCIGSVLMAEGFNSAIEAVCDMVSPERHPLIGRAKDIAAGAVLLMAVAAALAGGIIFIPKIIALL